MHKYLEFFQNHAEFLTMKFHEWAALTVGTTVFTAGAFTTPDQVWTMQDTAMSLGIAVSSAIFVSKALDIIKKIREMRSSKKDE